LAAICVVVHHHRVVVSSGNYHIYQKRKISIFNGYQGHHTVSDLAAHIYSTHLIERPEWYDEAQLRQALIPDLITIRVPISPAWVVPNSQETTRTRRMVK